MQLIFCHTQSRVKPYLSRLRRGGQRKLMVLMNYQLLNSQRLPGGTIVCDGSPQKRLKPHHAESQRRLDTLRCRYKAPHAR